MGTAFRNGGGAIEFPELSLLNSYSMNDRRGTGAPQTLCPDPRESGRVCHGTQSIVSLTDWRQSELYDNEVGKSPCI